MNKAAFISMSRLVMIQMLRGNPMGDNEGEMLRNLEARLPNNKPLRKI